VTSVINTGGVLINCLYAYSLDYTFTINTVMTVSAGETIKFYINVYDSLDVEYSSALLYTQGEISNGVLARILTGTVTVPKGYYMRIIAAVSNTGDTIDYNMVKFSVDATSQSFTTTDVTINITPQYLVHVDILTEALHGRASPKEKDMVALTEYFEVDGSPKDSLLSGNSLSPSSSRVSVNKIWVYPNDTALPIDGFYLPDITTELGSVLPLDSNYELSEVTIYKGTTYWALWAGILPIIKTRRVYLTCKYSRFEAWMPDAITPPAGTGWVAHDTITRNNGNETLWTALPYSGITAWTLGSLDTTGGVASGWEWVEKITSSRINNYPDADTSVTVPSRSLHDILQTIYTGTHESLVNTDVKSAFLWNDADANITPTAGKNYFLEQFAPAFGDDDNFLNNITCVHTYQFQTQSEESDQSELKVSLNKILEQLKQIFNYQIYWFVDSTTNDLHIEHIYYNDLYRSSLDLTTGTPSTRNSELLTEISEWDYDKSKMYSLINFEMANAGYKDFNNNIITFPKIPSNKRDKDISLSNKVDLLTLDVRYCVEFPADLDNGLVLVNHDDSYNTIKATVPIANISWENGNIALSNLIYNFAYEGVFSSGTINGKAKEFPVAMRSKKGKSITIKGLYDYEFFKSVVGQGKIESINYNLDEETTEITLRYRFGSDAETDVFELMVSIEGDYIGATSVLYDFGEV